MKLAYRISERTLMRSRSEPAYQPWSDWTIVAHTEGLNESDLRLLVSDWHMGDRIYWHGRKAEVREPYSRTEYRILEDAELFVDGKYLKNET